jgi:hypothetical protein
MRLHVVYDKGEILPHKSNVSPFPDNISDVRSLLTMPDTNVITWQLNDLPLTKKFVTSFINTIDSIPANSVHPSEIFIVDLYTTPRENDILKARQLMNDKIDFFNGLDVPFTIPEELKLNTEDLNDARIHNLNTLHEIFEDHCNNGYYTDTITVNELYEHFQEINILVHYNEQIFPFTGKNIGECRRNLYAAIKQHVTSIKMVKYIKRPGVYSNPLLPEDYNDFTTNKLKGQLMLDFGTVGKDLYTCAFTDDIALVKSGKVSQQIDYHPWVQYDWVDYSIGHYHEAAEQRYNDWIEKNNISEYIDLSDPKYTPGRHPLGHCISHDIPDAKSFVEQVYKDTPRVVAMCITDDNNNNVYRNVK